MNSTHPDHSVSKKLRRNRWVLMILALTLLGGVVWYLDAAEYTVDVVQAETPRPPPWVSIESVRISSETVEVSAFAEVRPRWTAELKAAVSGRITKVLASALAGERVSKGTALIEIENTRYVAELAVAELALKEAQLALWQAKNATVIARKEFERANKKPPNELALKLPQLDIAENAVKSAKARVAAAKRQRDDATVVAPFSGFVTDRFVSPGQTANLGDRLVKLVDNGTFELTVELSRIDWAQLKKPLEGLSANVVDQTGKTLAQAKIRKAGGFLDETTRQYRVFLEIEGDQGRDILSGDFVRVVLPGITEPDALNIPASSLTQEGQIWHVDTGNRLSRLTPKILFRYQDRIVIKAPDGMDTLEVAITPLASFLPGQTVRPY